ncbi:MAG: 16S rRNA (adenine(1518)-N(6)/adenine(1519)-N(6))-dimethyltransferase RsmA [Kiritimatiellae bacterium]|jgi:16S rRNA (adenine1518-N6/adenine1519-N6)-dimethyltransferase|nr:16S rRNA (adenine(1518)-N(6)/adenine(1519)-N(6))-dimethyltransferase RsmA [Kiritimatiellia bacterium]
MDIINLTSPTQVKSWCIENGFHPNRTLGQNFLIDRNALDAIIDGAGVVAGMRVLEIGPGLGVLTQAMLERGASVVTVEKDKRLAARLHEALGAPDALEVIEADALKLDLDEFLAQGFDACVSNLPYSVGTRILLDLALHADAPAVTAVLVQREVAERFAADAGESARGQAGVWLQLDYTVRIVRHVGATCFWPRPEVGSTVVRLDKSRSQLSEIQREYFFELTRYAFMHRRKQMGASLRKATGNLERTDAELAELLCQAGIAPATRAEQISNAGWQALAQVYAVGKSEE